MSWKPSRSSGIMFDKYDRAERKATDKINELLKSQEYCTFTGITQLSKAIYSRWINANKKHSSLTGGAFNKEKPFYSLHRMLMSDYFKNLLRNNPDHVYKPLREIFEQNPNLLTT